MPTYSLPPDFAPPALTEKIEILASHYHLSALDVVSLSVELLWDKKQKSDPTFARKAGSIKSEDLVHIFLDKYAEVELLRAEIMRRV